MTINFDKEEPVETTLRLTGGIGVDRVIEAVGVDAEAPGQEQNEGGSNSNPPPSNAQSGRKVSRHTSYVWATSGSDVIVSTTGGGT